METNGCVSCQKPKTTLQCGLCEEALCKSCAQFLDEDAFSFRANVAPELKHTTYCPGCYDTTVVPELAAYEEAIAQAHHIRVYEKNQGKETRLLRRKEKPVQVKNCLDRAEALLRLAYLAAELGYNGLLDVDVVGEKVRLGSYQTMTWNATGVPYAMK